MTIIIGVLFVGAGLIVSTLSGVFEAQAAGGRQIPLWRKTQGYRRPLVSSLLLISAALLVGIGVFFLLLVWGSVAVLLLSLAFVPPFAVIAVHNKSVKANA